MTKPRISVVIDTYNHERYVEQALISVFEQDFPAAETEILVIDDGSTDRTAEIVRRFAPRVRLVQKKNGGQASAFNTGIQQARAEIVAFLDGDDWFAPSKLTAVMKALEDNPQVAAVGHARYSFDEETKKVTIPAQVVNGALHGRNLLRATTLGAAREAFKAWPFLMTSAVTARKSLFNRIMPIPEVLTFCADIAIAVACMVEGVLILEQPLFYHRLHSTNLCSVESKGTAKMSRKVQMTELAFELVFPMLLRMGVSPEVARALVNPPWMADVNRYSVAAFGGSRLKALRTEMRCLNQLSEPGLMYRLFKYLVVAPATLLLPPRRFYNMREWYARRNLNRFREQFAPTSSTAAGPSTDD